MLFKGLIFSRCSVDFDVELFVNSMHDNRWEGEREEEEKEKEDKTKREVKPTQKKVKKEEEEEKSKLKTEGKKVRRV